MRKKFNLLAIVVLTFIFSMLVFPVVGYASEQCAQIDYVSNEWGVAIDDGKWHDTYAPEYGTYFEVTATHGATVTFGTKEGKMTETQPDSYDEKGNDVYRFFISAKMAKNGGKKLVTARLGSVETKLTVEFRKAEIYTDDVKGRYDIADKRYKYGKIIANNGTRTNYRLWASESSLDVDEDTTVDEWNDFMKPLVREGATVYISPNYYSGYSSKYEITDNSWIISTHGDLYKTRKVKLPAQKAAPKVKVDAVTGILSTNAKMEYAYKPLSAEDKNYSAWTAATAKQKILAITSPSIVADGLDIRIRVAGTDKKIPSCYKTITIPSSSVIDLSKIQLEGISTNASIRISDFDASQKPYEYTMDTPSSSTVWKKMNKNTLVFKEKTALSDGTKIYIRERGINENTKKSISLKMPSTIAEITVSGAAVDWKKEAYDMTLFDK